MVVEYYQLDYGFEVKILSGKYTERKGIIVMESRFGDVGINLNKKPHFGKYHTRERPSNLEIISIDDKYGIKKHIEDNRNLFIDAKWDVAMFDPQKVIDEKNYFPESLVDLAKTSSLLE